MDSAPEDGGSEPESAGPGSEPGWEMAERRAAAAEAELLVVRNELWAAQQAQREWDNLLDRLEHERSAERARAEAVADELAAITSSRTWRLACLVLSPYRRLRAR